MKKIEEKESAYIEFFENLSKQTPISSYKEIFEEQLIFQDPFHTIDSLSDLYALFQKMFASLEYASFKVIEEIHKENIMTIRWTFHYCHKNSSKQLQFEGMSYVQFNDKGKAIKHIDYWDAASNIYEKIPIIGAIIRFVKEKIRNAK